MISPFEEQNVPQRLLHIMAGMPIVQLSCIVAALAFLGRLIVAAVDKAESVSKVLSDARN
jgi:hypothetical protein